MMPQKSMREDRRGAVCLKKSLSLKNKPYDEKQMYLWLEQEE